MSARLSRKRGRGVANNIPSDTPTLSIARMSALGDRLVLKSNRCVISAPLGLGTAPSNDELIGRLVDVLRPSWESFVRIFIRRRGNMGNEERWLDEAQKRLGRLLERFHVQDSSKISTSLPLFIAYHPFLKIAVSHEGACPGFSAWFLEQHTSCTFNAGVFSPPLDFTHVPPRTASHASAREKTTLKHLSENIKYFENHGALVVAMYYNDKDELCFYKTEAIDLDSAGIVGAYICLLNPLFLSYLSKVTSCMLLECLIQRLRRPR